MRNNRFALLPSAIIGLSVLLTGCFGDDDDNGADTTNSAINHPAPNARQVDWSMETLDDGTRTVYQTATSLFEPSRTFETAEPSNLLPTVYENMRDSNGDIIPNTLPSTPENPYNLHGDPQISDIDPRSPRQDLALIINNLKTAADDDDFNATSQTFFANGEGVPADPRRGGMERTGEDAGTIDEPIDADIDFAAVDLAIDILEGNPIDRAYSGMPLLNYNGPNKVKAVDGETREVTVHQVWARARIMSDTAFIDPSAVQDETWTIRYVIDVLHAGHEDFSPMAMFFDDPADNDGQRIPHVAMDQTFFPMQEGKRYVFEIQMPPGRFWNLTYHWGWRVHPPRIQAAENALKMVMGKPIVDWETEVFGEDPMGSEENKLAAIDMIGDLAPAKRMWKAFKAIKAMDPEISTDSDFYQRFSSDASLAELVEELEASFQDWTDRTKLPRGVPDASPEIDETLFYVNNTIYGTMHKVRDGVHLMAQESFSEFQERGTTLNVQLYNGDYFPHAYMNVDFGGRRGWENTFQNTIPVGGQGPWFTFGRFHWWPNAMKPALVPAAQRPEALQVRGNGMLNMSQVGRVSSRRLPLPDPQQASAQAQSQSGGWLRRLVGGEEENSAPATDGKPYFTWDSLQHSGASFAEATTSEGLGEHRVDLTFNFDPAQRLRFYQFDPLHHDVAIFSVH